MFITLISDGKIHTTSLPEEADGMHWVQVPDAGRTRRLGLIEARDGVWVLSPKKGVALLDEGNAPCERAVLDGRAESAFRFDDGSRPVVMVARPSAPGDRTYTILGFRQNESISIGSAPDNDFVYASRFVSGQHARIDYAGERFSITDLGSASGTFVNGKRIDAHHSVELAPSDVVQVLGLTIAIGHRFVSFNNPSGALEVTRRERGSFVFLEKQQVVPVEEDEQLEEQEEEPDYFYPAPRFMRAVERRTFSVDAPPAAKRPDETPIAMKIGPSMVMALAAVFSAAMMFMRMQDSGGSVLMAAPMLVMAVSMVAGSVLWPILSKRFERKRAQQAEEQRRRTYSDYLDRVRALIRQEADHQKEVLEENRISVEECMRRAFDQDPRLMDRSSGDADFLDVRLGRGTVPLEADIRWPEERFAVEKDELLEHVYQLSREPKDLEDAPVALHLADNPVIGVAGPAGRVRQLLYGIVAQVACLCSYEDVKVAVLADEEEKDAWGWACALPHAFSDDRSARFAAFTLEEASELGLMLGGTIEQRREQGECAQGAALPHFVVVCASKHLAGKSDLVDGLARRPVPGFTVVCAAEQRKDLPKQCTCIVELGEDGATMYAKDDTAGAGIAFSPDAFVGADDCVELSAALNEIDLDIASGRSALPDSIDFMGMYEAGNVEQLNVRSRWAERKASETLAARIGVDAAGEPFYLNLHEKFHGPHGLIAGTTGSGKSEFIIAWILSMCVEYSPEEAAFVLIDYKGGGLAGAFDNADVRPPHLAGTVTNLDGAAIARSLASIRSELRRRQALFNSARHAAGGGNVDIYRYLELYREGKVEEPCPHLFIVADEFAELKQQEPEFMDELVSAARIGRSLGVHLVLATQKPTGVVNDQIRANSKFKVCLKVADAADSKEMIRREDAAAITQAGRFYMLVGYVEQFSCGQAAWAGAPYEAAAQYVPAQDDAVELVGSTGRVLMQMRPARQRAASGIPQLSAVLAHIAACAAEEGLCARRLWLDPLPERIPVGDLRKRYAAEFERMQKEPFVLEAAVGELDDPANQAKRLLTLPLSAEGNAVVYGSAGSGTEAVVAAALLSLLQVHDSNELNVYIMDFGTEFLRAFESAPQVGDVLVVGETEKTGNLMRMLQKELSSRRGKLSQYGGDREAYAAATGERMPAILVIIEGFEQFCEMYERLLPTFIELSRDGSRVGMWFLITSTRANGVPFRVLPNFKQKLALELASQDEYLSLFGSIHGLVVPKGFARGVVKFDKDYFIFQGAMPFEGEDAFGAIKAFCLQQSGERAGSVPVLPDVVDAGTFASYPISVSAVPVGLAKDDLSVQAFDFTKELSWVVSGNDSDAFAPFVEQVVAEFKNAGIDYVVLDALKQDAASLDEAIRQLVETEEGNAKGQSVIIIPSLTALQDTLGIEALTMFKSYVEGVTLAGRHRFLACDDAASFSALGIAPWVKKLSGKGNGVWIGNGISGQMLLKMVRTGVRLDDNPEKGMGYFVYKSTATLVKYIGFNPRQGVHR